MIIGLPTLIDRAALTSAFSKDVLTAAYTQVTKQVEVALLAGHKPRLNGLGTFMIKQGLPRKVRAGIHDPRMVELPAKKRVKFRPSPELSEKAAKA